MGQRKILTPDVPRGDEAYQRLHGLAGTGHHHQATRVLVQPVHDAGPGQAAGTGIPAQQAVEQRSAPVARRGVNHQARRFIDHQQVCVLVHHVQFHGFWFERLTLLRRAQLNGARTAHPHPGGRLVDWRARQRHGTRVDELLQVAAGKFRHQCDQSLVQPQPMQVRAYRPVASLTLGATLGGVVQAGLGSLVGVAGRYNGFALLQEGCL